MVDVNLLPWRARCATATRRGQIMKLKGLGVIGLLLLSMIGILLQLNAGKQQNIDNWRSPSLDAAEVSIAPEENQQKNFLLMCRKISLSEQFHVQLNSLHYENHQTRVSGDVNSIDDLSAWIRKMNAEGLRVLVKQLGKPLHADRFHFVAVMQMMPREE